MIVTAQRREERLRDVPLAVTALGADDLSRLRVTDMSRIQYETPGLSFGKQGADFFPAIRGVRTQLVSVQSDPVIGFYIDGIYQSRVAQQSFPLFDLSRVEVQRGPQGTLYGRNTFGGNVSIVTHAPTEEFEGGVNAQIGNYDLRQVDGFINVPLNEKVQFRVAADHIEHSGYTRSTTNPSIELQDEDQNAVRLSARFKPTDALQIDLSGAYWERKDHGGGAFASRVSGTLINPATGLRSVNGVPVYVNPTVHNGTAFVAGVDAGVPVNTDPYTNQWDYNPYERLHERYLTAQVSYDFGPVALKSITGYNSFGVDRSADLDQTSVVFPAPGVVNTGFTGSGYQAQNTMDSAFSQELQLASTGKDRLQWIVGGYYFRDRVLEYYRQVYTAPSAVPANLRSTRSRVSLQTESYAGYGQATFALIPDTLRLIGGVRYSSDTKTFGITNQTASPGTEDFTTQTAQVANGAPSFSKATFRVGAEFNLTPETMLYSTISTGYESGGFNNNASNALIPNSYNPQTVTAYEIGSKSRWLGGRLSLDLSVFDNEYKNLQITILDRITNLSYTQSAGAARSRGVEAEMKFVPVANLHLGLTATLLDAKFTQYVRPNAFHVAGGDDGVTVDLSGKRVPMSPKFKGTLSASYDFDLGAAGMLTPRGNLLYSSAYYAADYNTVLDKQTSYVLVDLGLRWTEKSDKFYVEVFGENVGDKAVLYAATLGSSARVQTSYGPPSLYGARFGARF
ncbi:TonB-dependent receptor [Roseiterribacter gracilis]|uniref:TonB-dependent receptor n=1 Tax=Roseiterribacter gracilis TaxID=2812848 RepID=A0A8S8X846_9PROT|nr:hypothetical protein TMPK1_18200 [Rhodospirillales bacterium TMPK1]